MLRGDIPNIGYLITKNSKADHHQKYRADYIKDVSVSEPVNRARNTTSPVIVDEIEHFRSVLPKNDSKFGGQPSYYQFIRFHYRR